MKRQNTAGLYLRLSRDDGGDAESNSIQTQRMMLQKYAKDRKRQMLVELIEKIVIFTGTGRGRDRDQRIDIYYRINGLIDSNN